jgi:hypothetical protein
MARENADAVFELAAELRGQFQVYKASPLLVLPEQSSG